MERRSQRRQRGMKAPYEYARYWWHTRRWNFPELNRMGDIWDPFCFSCGWQAPERDDWYTDADLSPKRIRSLLRKRWQTSMPFLQRAHLKDHIENGSDEPDNVLMLCDHCHQQMPAFGERGPALVWVRDRAVFSLSHGVPREWGWIALRRFRDGLVYRVGDGPHAGKPIFEPGTWTPTREARDTYHKNGSGFTRENSRRAVAQ